MDPERFVHSLRIAVRDAAISDTIGYIAAPPGRKIAEDTKKLSTWYNALANEDKEMLLKAMEKAVDNAVFGFLCVLDGVRVIEDSKPRGTLRLTYIGRSEVALSPPEGPLLHELY
jgi:hypothetical protein